MIPYVLILLLTFHLGNIFPQPSKKDRPTKLAHYQTGVYLAAQGTRLRVNVDKQLGGSVSVQLVDPAGKLYFEQTLTPLETVARFSLDITELADGEYRLKISNGLEMEIRTIRIATPRSTTVNRTLTIR